MTEVLAGTLIAIWEPENPPTMFLDSWPTEIISGIFLSRYTWGSFVTQQQKINRHTYFLFAMRKGFPASPSPEGKALLFSVPFPWFPLLLNKHVPEIWPERLDSLWTFIVPSQCLSPCSSAYRICYMRVKSMLACFPDNHCALNSLSVSKGGPWQPQWMDGVISEYDQRNLIKCLWQYEDYLINLFWTCIFKYANLV